MEAKIDKFGRVLIPKKVRAALNLESGDNLEIAVVDNQILLKPMGGESAVVIKEGVAIYRVVDQSEIDDALQLDRDERLSKLMSGYSTE